MSATEASHSSVSLALVVAVGVMVIAATLSGVYLSSGPLQRTVTQTETSTTTSVSTSTTTSTTTTISISTAISTTTATSTTTALSTTTSISTTTATVFTTETQFVTVEATSTYRSGGYAGGDVIQSCQGSASDVSSASCALGFPVTKGHLLVVELSDVPPGSVNDSLGNSFRLVSSALLTGATYYIQVYVAVAASSGVDTFIASGAGNFPSMVVHELNLNSVASTSELSGDSISPSVGAYAPPAGSFVLGVVLAANHGESIAPGQSQTLMGQYPGVIGDECFLATGGEVTSPFVLSDQQTWGEVSVAFT